MCFEDGWNICNHQKSQSLSVQIVDHCEDKVMHNTIGSVNLVINTSEAYHLHYRVSQWFNALQSVSEQTIAFQVGHYQCIQKDNYTW